MPSDERTKGWSGGAGRRVLLGVLVATLAMVGFAQGGFAASSDFLFGADATVAPAPPAPLPAVPALVDLHDGRSPVSPRWQANFERFAEDDRRHPSTGGGIVFVGSSSIDFWSDLPAQFPTFDIVQRGLGGATMADCARHVDRLILPSRPRVVVLYAGDNDLATGVAPERIVADYAAIVHAVHEAAPATRFVFVSIKPSPSRAALIPAMRRTNALMEAFAGTEPLLEFVDIFPLMLDGEGNARRELFGPDRLHMNGGGYALWRDAIRPHLD